MTMKDKAAAVATAAAALDAAEKALVDPADPGNSLAEGEAHADVALGAVYANIGGHLAKFRLRSVDDGK
jgi:hypothetical protein